MHIVWIAWKSWPLENFRCELVMTPRSQARVNKNLPLEKFLSVKFFLTIFGPYFAINGLFWPKSGVKIMTPRKHFHLWKKFTCEIASGAKIMTPRKIQVWKIFTVESQVRAQACARAPSIIRYPKVHKGTGHGRAPSKIRAQILVHPQNQNHNFLTELYYYNFITQQISTELKYFSPSQSISLMI